MAKNEKAWGVGFKRLIGDESLGETWGIVVDDTNKQLHILGINDVELDLSLSADTVPALYVHGSASASEYVKIYDDATDGYFKVVGGNARIESAGDIHLEPVATTGYVKVGGTQSWVATGTSVVAIATGADGLGTAITEWLVVENEDGSARYVPSWCL